MNCDKCGRQMHEYRIGWFCPAHRLRLSRVEDRRMLERGYAAMTTAVCFGVLAVVIVAAVFMRGCSPAPVQAYSMCEMCGEVIADADHGRCKPLEVASCE